MPESTPIPRGIDAHTLRAYHASGAIGFPTAWVADVEAYGDLTIREYLVATGKMVDHRPAASASHPTLSVSDIYAARRPSRATPEPTAALLDQGQAPFSNPGAEAIYAARRGSRS